MKGFHFADAVARAEQALAYAAETLKTTKANLRAFKGGAGQTSVANTPGAWKPVKVSSNLGKIVAALDKGVAPKQIAADLGYTAKWGEKEGTAYVWWQCRHVLLPNHGIETVKDGEAIRLRAAAGEEAFRTRSDKEEKNRFSPVAAFMRTPTRRGSVRRAPPSGHYLRTSVAPAGFLAVNPAIRQ